MGSTLNGLIIGSVEKDNVLSSIISKEQEGIDMCQTMAELALEKNEKSEALGNTDKVFDIIIKTHVM
jgi:hypothetical protein